MGEYSTEFLMGLFMDEHIVSLLRLLAIENMAHFMHSVCGELAIKRESSGKVFP